MLTALIILATAAALLLALVAVTVVTGWFPRLAALSVRGLEAVVRPGAPTRLTLRDRSELVARLWVPWLVI